MRPFFSPARVTLALAIAVRGAIFPAELGTKTTITRASGVTISVVSYSYIEHKVYMTGVSHGSAASYLTSLIFGTGVPIITSKGSRKKLERIDRVEIGRKSSPSEIVREDSAGSQLPTE